MRESSIIVATISADRLHLEQASAMIQSLAENSPDDRVRLYVVDGTGYPAELINPACESVEVSLCLSEAKKEDIPGIMSCHRTMIIKEALHDYDRVAYIDCDAIIRKSLDEFWHDVEPNCIKVMHRPHADQNCKFQAGIFAIGKSPNVVKMIDEYDKRVQRNVYFLAEQQMLYEAWHGSDVSLVEMGSEFNDWHFDDQSTIWHCKANHFTEKKYQKEYRRHLDAAYAKVLGIPA